MQVHVFIALFMAVLEIIAYCGVMTGWSAIVPVLIEEQFFTGDCPFNKTTRNTTTQCQTQVESLNLVYTIATGSAPIFSVASGYILDKTGGWVTRTLMILVESFGFFLLAITRPSTSWLLFPSFMLINIGGFGLCTANLEMCNLSPRSRSTVLSLLCGCMSTSVLVFLAVNKLYFTGGVSFTAIFVFFTCLSVLFHINTFILTPRFPTPRVLPDEYVFGYKELSCYNKTASVVKVLPPETSSTLIESQSLSKSLHDPTYWTNVAHSCAVNFALAYFIGSFNSWIVTRVAESQVDIFTTIVNITIAMGALISPISGFVNDYLRRRFLKSAPLYVANMKAASITLFTADFFVVLMLACSLISDANVQYVTMAMQVLARCFLYSSTATFVSVGFPEKHFGVLYNLLGCISGVVLLLQYPVTLLVTRVFDSSFQVVYSVLVGVCGLSSLHPLFLQLRSRRYMNDVLGNDIKVPRL